MQKAKYLLLALAILVISATSAMGQEVRATIGGKVTDAQGAVVPEAAITITSEDTEVIQHATTNTQGNWVVQFLLPGTYRFSIEKTGFKKAERKNIHLQAADNKTVDVQLAVGSAVEVVDVSAEAPLIDTTSATSGAVITQREISEMPSVSRVPTLLATLAPGVAAQDQNNNPIRAWSYYGASQISSDGGYASSSSNGSQMIRSNNYQLDGMPNTKSGGYVSYIPSTDSLQEFRVQTNAYDAQISRQAGATINMETKAGGKAYHGSLYEFNQNNTLNALQYGVLKSKKPPLHLNQYGGTFGGPVRIPYLYNGKEKTFFFVSFEGLRNSNPQITYRSVPTELERNGDFSQSFTIVGGQRYAVNVYDPAAVAANGNRQQFAGNVIPTARINPIAQKILAYVPLPNHAPDLTQGNSVNNYESSAFRGDKMAGMNFRFDHQWNDAHRSFGVYRWNLNNDVTSNDFENPATGVYQSRTPKSVGVDHVWTVSNNKVLDTRFTVNRFEEITYDGGAHAGFDQASLGLPTSLTSKLHPSFPNITGFAGNFGTANATYTINTYYVWNAGMSQMHGNHALKYGTEFWILQQANGNYGLQPQFTFGNEWTRPIANVAAGTGQGSNFASFLLGLPNGGTVNRNATAYYSQYFTGVYFQDDWRVTPKLTLNLGLRWDVERPVTERYNRMVSNYDPTAVSPINGTAQAVYAANAANPANASNTALQTLLQYVPTSAFKVLGAQQFAGVNGQSNTVHNTDWREFQPRFGFAYQITPTLVVRGGTGRFAMASWEQAGQNGFSQNTTFTATKDNYFTAYDTLSNPYHDGLLDPKGASLGAMSNLGNNPFWVNQNPDRPYTWNTHLEVQKDYKGWLFEVGYTHTKTQKLWVNQIDNFTSLDLWKQLRTPTFDASGKPVATLMWDQLVPNPFYGISGVLGTSGTSKTIAMNQLLRPVNLLGDGLTRNDNPIGTTQYDALTGKIEHRFNKGFSVLASFTYAKNFDNTGFWGPQISGYVFEHRLADQDRPFHLSVASIYDLPFGRGRMFGTHMPKALDFIAGGWELSGQYTIQSGTPVTFGTDSFFSGKDPGDVSWRSRDRWFDTSQFAPFPTKTTCLVVSAQCSAATVYPTWTGIQNLPGYNYVPVTSSDPKNGVYQDFATFIRRYPTRFGSVRTPHVNELNLGIYKNFKPIERIRLQYRFEVFNVLNNVRFGGPNTDPSSTGFGKITPNQQNQARQVQMALKLYF
jgi:hypothetical protein